MKKQLENEKLTRRVEELQNQNELLKTQMMAKDNVVHQIKQENEAYELELHKKTGQAELPAEELKDEFQSMTLDREKKRFLKAMIMGGAPTRRNKSV